MSSGAKKLIFEEAAREKLCAGVETLVNVLGTTLGPKGRSVSVDSGFGAPKISSSGSSIVGDIELKDQFENMGVSLGKEMVQKIKQCCGDAGVTGIVLLGALVTEGMKHVSAGISPVFIKKGLDLGLKEALQAIDKLSKPLNSDEINKIATASASGDTEVGHFIAEAFAKVKKGGVISIFDGKGTQTSIEIVEGMRIDRGYLSAYFCTNRETMTCEMEKPFVLVTDTKISSIHEILPLLQNVAATGRPLVIIADDIEADALSTLVVNQLRGMLKVAAIKAPGFGDRRKAMLGDIATILGATVVSQETGIELKNATSEVLGSCEKIQISKEETTIVGGCGEQKTIESRIRSIEAEIKASESEYDKEKLQERKAKLSGGVALIRVGGTVEAIVKEKKALYENSLSSTRSAVEGGTVPGGGMSYLRAAQNLHQIHAQGEEKIGIEILYRSLRAPFKQMLANGGFDPAVIMHTVLEKEESFGFNLETGTIENLIESGIVDPTQVVKTALEHAVSMCAIILTSEALVGDDEDQ